MGVHHFPFLSSESVDIFPEWGEGFLGNKAAGRVHWPQFDMHCGCGDHREGRCRNLFPGIYEDHSALIKLGPKGEKSTPQKDSSPCLAQGNWGAHTS
jgi:hypothetical protein